MELCLTKDGSAGSAGSELSFGSDTMEESFAAGEPDTLLSDPAGEFCLQPVKGRSMKKASNRAIKQLNFFILLPRFFLGQSDHFASVCFML
jgi:hypothetical protein